MSIHTTQTVDSRIVTDSTTIALANSVVELERGPAGTVAFVRHDSGRVEYVGPLPDATISALREVGR